MKLLILTVLGYLVTEGFCLNDDEEISSTLTTDIVLESPKVTDFGDWGPWEYCPPGTYAAGMALKSESYQGSDDDTALNGIRLFCIPPGSNNFADSFNISSTVNDWGNWGKSFYCDGGVVSGFQLRSEDYLGRMKKDDTGANNLRIFCSNLMPGSYLEGDANAWGEWSEPQKCLKQQAICGIQTQSQQYAFEDDDTALNNVNMKCCTVPNIGSNCGACDNWETILTCDNTRSSEPMKCSYEKTRGVSKSSSATESMLEEYKTMLDIGFDASYLYNGLSLNFQANLSTSINTGYSWTNAVSETFHEATTTSAEFVVPGGMKSRLSQAVGACGIFNVYTNFFMKEDMMGGTEIVVDKTVFYS